jgi:hypothetical protein
VKAAKVLKKLHRTITNKEGLLNDLNLLLDNVAMRMTRRGHGKHYIDAEMKNPKISEPEVIYSL